MGELPKSLIENTNNVKTNFQTSDLIETPVIICAGFYREEIFQIRVVLDTVGSKKVRIVPCTETMLWMSVALVKLIPEPQWNYPYKNHESNHDYSIETSINYRCLFLGNMSSIAQQTIQGLLSNAGLRQFKVVTESKNNNKLLGQLFGYAKQNYPQPPSTDVLAYLKRDGRLFDGTHQDAKDVLKTYLKEKKLSHMNTKVISKTQLEIKKNCEHQN